jgi:hypothetical protein
MLRRLDLSESELTMTNYVADHREFRVRGSSREVYAEWGFRGFRQSRDGAKARLAHMTSAETPQRDLSRLWRLTIAGIPTLDEQMDGGARG